MLDVFYIDVTDALPLYAQLERAVRYAIVTGKLHAGDQLPTVRQMAVALRINANTVAKVYAELERVGILETRRGVGTFVRARDFEAVQPSDQQRELGYLVDRFLAETASLGFSLDEVLDHLHSRREKEN
jgi:GntR family transcriptional regulator